MQKRLLAVILAAFLMLSPAFAAQITRQHADTIVNGLNANATDVSDELNSLVNESNGQDTRLTNIESSNQTISGNKTFAGSTTFAGSATFNTTTTLSGTNTLSGTSNFTGQLNLARTADPGSPNAGDYWFNSTSALFKGYSNSVARLVPLSTTLAKSGNYTAVQSDNGTTFICTSTFNLTLPAASQGNGWLINVKNNGMGVVTIVGTIDGASNLILEPGASAQVISDNSAFYSQNVRRKVFLSAQQTITSAGALTIAHGLGQKPLRFELILVCQTGELGYTAGDELVMPWWLMVTSSRGVSLVPDATNLNIRYGSDANVFQIPNKTTGTGQNATNGNWKMVVRAWVE